MFALQAAQPNILTYAKGHPSSTTFHRSAVVEIKIANLNIPAFQQAIEAITQRHDALRSYISLKNIDLYQRVHSTDTLDLKNYAPLQLIDATKAPYTPPLSLEATLHGLGRSDLLNEPFQLDQAPLWRSALIQFDETTYQFLFLAHHIIIDETSIGILFNDISAYYNAYINNTQPDLPAVPPLNAELTLALPEAVKNERLAYWKKSFNQLNILKLPADKQESNAFAFRGRRHYFHLDAEFIAELKRTFPTQSINNLFLASLSTLCYRYTSGSETDVCLGITSANRRHDIPGIDKSIIEKNLVNCLFNSLPIRIAFSSSDSFSDLLLIAKQQVGNALKNQLSLDKIHQEALSTETKQGLHTASPFSIMLTTNAQKPTLNLGGTRGSYPVELHIGGHTKFSDFGINLDEQYNGSQAGFIEYNTQRFHESTIERLLGHLVHILKTVVLQPNILIKDICILQPEELQRIASYNNTDQHADFTTLADALHETSKRIPNKPALQFHTKGETHVLNYTDLDTQSTKLANYLLSCGYLPGQHIGVCLPRSLNLIITVFAVLKAGMVLVTLETQADKQNLIDKKSKPLDCIITDQDTMALVPDHHIINLDDENTRTSFQAASHTYIKQNIHPNSLAYIMYSSGTTGEPKGTMIAHRGIANLLSTLAKTYPADTSQINTAAFTFDAAIFDLALLTLGNTMHFLDEENRYSPHHLNQVIKNNNINILVMLPDILKALDPALPSTDITSMGGKPDMTTIREWKRANPSRTFRNGYGPTENTICTSLYPITDTPGVPSTLIGKPIQNTKIFIVDADNALCPISVPGQLIITGPGVALGYTNNQEKSSSAFKALRLDASKQKLIAATPDDPEAMPCYFTGDLGSYYQAEDGNISVNFISRINRELKIRGVPVNLDILENALRKHPDVHDVFIHTKNNETLFAFIIPKDPRATNDELKLRRSIRAFLLANTTLPRVAYPRDVIILREFILNTNGKIDTANLPYTETSSNIPLGNINNLNALESEILRLWSTLLQLPIDKIDLEETFHINGGDSILAVQLESRLNNHPRFSLHPPVTAAELLTSTINSLAGLLGPRCQLNVGSLNQHSVFSTPGSYPLELHLDIPAMRK